MTRNHDTSFFAQNLSITRSFVYFMVAMCIGIVGGLTNQLWLMLSIFIPAVMAIMGWDPFLATYRLMKADSAKKTVERKMPQQQQDLGHKVA